MYTTPTKALTIFQPPQNPNPKSKGKRKNNVEITDQMCISELCNGNKNDTWSPFEVAASANLGEKRLLKTRQFQQAAGVPVATSSQLARGARLCFSKFVIKARYSNLIGK